MFSGSIDMSFSVVANQREKWLGNLVESGAIGTPALAIDTADVQKVLDLFTRHLPEAKLFYAMKANNAPLLLQFLASKGVNFDVASSTEIRQLRSLGVAPSRMILSNPVKGPTTINTFLDEGLKLCVVDNPHDIEMLSLANQRRGDSRAPIGVFVRIRIPSTDVQIDLNQKFGATEEEAVELLGAVHRAGFQARGVQFHVGTQSWNTSNYRMGITTALRILDTARKKYGVKCDAVNIGGGYPDPLIAKESGGIESFFMHLREAISPAIERGLTIIAEPGRVMVSGACSAICTIIGKSVRNGTPWIYLDDGAYGLFSGKFFDHKEYQFRVLESKKPVPAAARLTPYVVAGPTCDSLDVICQTTLLPANLEPGDILCTHNMGAYSLVTACSFNGFGEINVYVGDSNAERKNVRELSRPALRKVGNS